MKLFDFKRAGKAVADSFTTRAFRVGGYSVAAAVIVMVIAVVVNILAGALPTKYTQLDTSSDKLYSLSQQTEELVSGLQDDVDVYWIVQSGQEDATLSLLLDRYSSLGGKLSVAKTDPDVSPGFIREQGISSVSNNSLLVVSGGKSRYVGNDEIFVYDYSNYYTTGSYDVSFAGESALTSAISFVVSDDLPKLYTLSGHGEAQLSSSFSSAVASANIETAELSLLRAGSVPEDADAVLIYAPQSDLSDSELASLRVYLKSGGDLLLITDPPQNGALPNMALLMSDYGVSAVDGIVVERDQNRYAFGAPYYLLPQIARHDITAPLVDGGYYVLLPVAQGLTVSDELPSSVTAETILATSSSAFSKSAGYELSTVDKEEGDTDGPFALAVAVTDAIDDETVSHIVWVSSAGLLDDQTNAQVSGGNQDFFLNALGWMCGQTDSISIHAKSLSSEYLTISSGAGALMAVVIVGVLPLGCIAVGVDVYRRRKRR